uniref:Uncharacterized protein n=1 Tax=Micrurus paraensis TaxID=1970185 RepID=A0A2D4K7S5_9SAUR
MCGIPSEFTTKGSLLLSLWPKLTLFNSFAQARKQNAGKKKLILSLWDVSCIQTQNAPYASDYFLVASGVVLTQAAWLVDALTHKVNLACFCKARFLPLNQIQCIMKSL